MAQETIARPRLSEKILMTVQVLMIHGFVVMAHPSRHKREKAMWLVPVPGVTLSIDHTFVCSSRQGAGIPDFPNLSCLSGKSRGLHAWEMVRRACHSPAGRENGLFLPTSAGGGQSEYGQQGTPLQYPARR